MVVDAANNISQLTQFPPPPSSSWQPRGSGGGGSVMLVLAWSAEQESALRSRGSPTQHHLLRQGAFIVVPKWVWLSSLPHATTRLRREERVRPWAAAARCESSGPIIKPILGRGKAGNGSMLNSYSTPTTYNTSVRSCHSSTSTSTYLRTHPFLCLAAPIPFSYLSCGTYFPSAVRVLLRSI